MKSFIFLFTLPILLVGCTFLQKTFKDPATNFLRRGSCLSIDIPPITLTPQRTSAERQLIGEDREIEKDGWLLASTRSTSRTNETVAIQDSRRVYREQAILEFYAEPLREYARAGVLGEVVDEGKVTIVPEIYAPRTGRFRSPDEVEAARRMGEEINKSRSYLLQYFLKKEKEKGSDVSSAERAFKAAYLKDVRPGEWILAGGWTRQK
ncbi:MAG: hypothetical protein K8S54_04140 [Spirochaetia bacterium]|nr:hypothetical protein [Spirochaetia bacterium]